MNIEAEECPGCGKEYKYLAKHWNKNSQCSHPTITPRQIEILTGLLLGDGSVYRKDTPYIQAHMNTKPFLEWLDEEFQHNSLSTGVRRAHEGGTESHPNPSYRWQTRSHPKFEYFAEWYSGGNKDFPDDLHLTPLSAKVWYCCDGSLKYTDGLPYVWIANSDQSHRADYLESLFQKHGFDPSFSSETLKFSGKNRERFFEWIGDPLPGFEYKWIQ